MSRTVFVDGAFLPEEEAKVSIFDRGFLFADGVYEVCSVLAGKLLETDGHVQRLHRSLDLLGIPAPISDQDLIAAMEKLVTVNAITEGLVYLQITRGPADRDFAYPSDPKPTIVMFTQQKALSTDPLAEKGIQVVTLPDLRWGRCDIKTVGLLYPCMAKMQAKSMGAQDAWLLDPEGFITEGTSNNAYIVTKDDVIVTRHLSNSILHGITRRAVLDLASDLSFTIEERPFTPDEAYAAKEAFFTSASSFVMPVVKIDETTIGDGTPGPFSRQLRKTYIDLSLKS